MTKVCMAISVKLSNKLGLSKLSDSAKLWNKDLIFRARSYKEEILATSTLS